MEPEPATRPASTLTHLECSGCGEVLPPGDLHGLCPKCAAPLLARYDLRAARATMTRADMAGRPANLWRYREVLPDPGRFQSLGEGWTPLLHAPRLGKAYGMPWLYLKDESVNPTGSFKARGLAVAVAVAARFGVRRLCLPSAGNAGSAAAAYGAAAGLPVYVFLPEETPAPFFQELAAYGAIVERVAGHIGDAGRLMRERMAAEPGAGWLDLSTLKEPYRVEGKKTMGYELAEQLPSLPDVILYPAGGGTGLIGMWKAFDELEALGWVDERRPRMVAVQMEGCAPIVRAFERGERHATPWADPWTIASGLRVPAPLGDALMLEALAASQGTAVAVQEDALADAVREIGRTTGVMAAPEGAAVLLALRQLVESGWIDLDERVVLFNTGTALKYLDGLGLAP